MAIDRSFGGVWAAGVSILALLMAGNFNAVRCHAAAPDLGDDVAPYATVADSNDPQTRSDPGSIIGWGSQRIDSSVFNAPFIAIAAGDAHSLALKKDGSIVGWGDNGYGQATPPDGNDFIAIAAGSEHSLALKKDGSILGWGNNDNGRATAPAGNDFIAIDAGDWHSLAIRREEPSLLP
jgi:hypothetical protein